MVGLKWQLVNTAAACHASDIVAKETHIIFRTTSEAKRRWRAAAWAMDENLSQFLAKAADMRINAEETPELEALRMRALHSLRTNLY